MPNMDDSLGEEEVSMIFDELEVQNSLLKISFSWRRRFLKLSLSTKGAWTTSFPQTTTHADHDQAEKLVLVFDLARI